jgi:prepilin-type N-terminal cleavage/methylation domain-containing protein
MRKGDRPSSVRHERAAGYTLIELTVASTVMSLFAIAISSASAMYFGLLDDVAVRTENARNANLIRARMIGDAKGATAVCAGGGVVHFDDGARQVEYSASDGALLRWVSATDRDTPIAERVNGLTCSDHGERGLEVDLALGTAEYPFYVYFHLAAAPEEEEEEGG